MLSTKKDLSRRLLRDCEIFANLRLKLCWARPPSHQQRTSPRIIFGIIIYAEKSRPSFRSRCHAAGPGPGRSVPGCSYSLCSVSGDLSGVPFHLDSYNLGNFIRHYLWIITSVFSCTFCTFCVPKAQMRVWGDTPLPCCAPPFSRGTASTPLVYADMQKINLHTGESFAIPKIMIVPQTNCLIRLRIKLFFIKACKILLCNAIFCCCMSRYGVV